MTRKEVIKKYNDWVKAPKPKIKETPRKGEVIGQLFFTSEKSSLFVDGVIINNEGRLEGDPRKEKYQTYPYFYIIKSNCDEYKEGQVVYLSDDLLKIELNPEYEDWYNKNKHQRPQMMGVPPPKYLGGVYAIERFKFKKDKFSLEEDNDFLYQLQIPQIRGVYEP